MDHGRDRERISATNLYIWACLYGLIPKSRTAAKPRMTPVHLFEASFTLPVETGRRDHSANQRGLPFVWTLIFNPSRKYALKNEYKRRMKLSASALIPEEKHHAVSS
ncbi:hypothetical protein Y1Q_0023320 [Alligator mississippiensis]|uniref:Uncharacterized protein n=1 Tax=Alligator mississippiensis TaxID=8496 RepID=A0A151NP81_ALLMI|nr:hypothetical protein Y1Q_0023320 [Alligator mississippiensis]